MDGAAASARPTLELGQRWLALTHAQLFHVKLPGALEGPLAIPQLVQ